MFSTSLWRLFGMSHPSRHVMTRARNDGWTISAPLTSVVEPPSSVTVNQWWTRPSPPTESHANDVFGVISVTVLCSRWTSSPF